MGYQPNYDHQGRKKPSPPMTWKDWVALAVLVAFLVWLCFSVWYLTNYIASEAWKIQ